MKRGTPLLAYCHINKIITRVDAFEYAGGELGQDKGVLRYVDQHFEGLLDTAPGTPPVPPLSPDLLELGGRATFTADEVEELTLPLETYICSVETYVADISVWRNRKENHVKLKSQRGRDIFLGMLLLANAGDKYKKLKESLDDDYLKGNNTYPNSPESALTMLCDHVPVYNTSQNSNRGRQDGNSSGGGNGRHNVSNNSNTRSGNGTTQTVWRISSLSVLCVTFQKCPSCLL